MKHNIEVVLLVEAPTQICEACAEHARWHAATGTVWVHCFHNNSAAFRTRQEGWRVLTNVAQDEIEMLALDSIESDTRGNANMASALN